MHRQTLVRLFENGVPMTKSVYFGSRGLKSVYLISPKEVRKSHSLISEPTPILRDPYNPRQIEADENGFRMWSF